MRAFYCDICGELGKGEPWRIAAANDNQSRDILVRSMASDDKKAAYFNECCVTCADSVLSAINARRVEK